jgi:hypothetical protein
MISNYKMNICLAWMTYCIITWTIITLFIVLCLYKKRFELLTFKGDIDIMIVIFEQHVLSLSTVVLISEQNLPDNVSGSLLICKIYFQSKLFKHIYLFVCLFVWWCLTPLSTIFQAILWRSVLMMEEIGLPGENHRPVASHWQTLSHNVVYPALIVIVW